MEHKREMRLMLSRTGVLVVGVTSVARGSEGENERERESLRAACLVCPACPRCPTLSLLQRVSATCLRKALDIPFYRYKEMPSCTMGCCCEITWSSEKCLEPCRRTAVGAAWILLTLSCFRRGLRAIRRHGRTWGSIITCCRSNLRWDTGLVPS
jgi:hypothetical protein